MRICFWRIHELPCASQKNRKHHQFWVTNASTWQQQGVCRTLWATQLISDTPSALIRPANLTVTSWCIDSSSFGFSSSGIRSRLANYYYKPKWRWRCHRRGEKVLMILLRSRPGATWGAINHSRRHAPASQPPTLATLLTPCWVSLSFYGLWSASNGARSIVLYHLRC